MEGWRTSVPTLERVDRTRKRRKAHVQSVEAARRDAIAILHEDNAELAQRCRRKVREMRGTTRKKRTRVVLAANLLDLLDILIRHRAPLVSAGSHFVQERVQARSGNETAFFGFEDELGSKRIIRGEKLFEVGEAGDVKVKAVLGAGQELFEVLGKTEGLVDRCG